MTKLICDFIDEVDNQVRRVNRNYSFSDFEAYIDNCSRPGLLERYIYIFVPDTNLQKEVKKAISNYTKQEGLTFIVTAQEFCDDRECHGHYIDPFEKGFNHKEVYVNRFPRDISGTYLHILKKNAVKKLKNMSTSLKEAIKTYATA